MARCTRTDNLEVHHIRRDGGNKYENAQVLCKDCHAATETYGKPGKTPPAFNSTIKAMALDRAKNQCECTSNRGCH